MNKQYEYRCKSIWKDRLLETKREFNTLQNSRPGSNRICFLDWFLF